ncbi:MAG TPA: ROK family protein [Caulobacteraceae bacterium]|nr:ROK family protein [Caulobacteraceae bacterium]
MIRIGVDFGRTKIEAAALDADGRFQARVRKPNPGGYDTAQEAVRDLVAEAERQSGAKGSVGVGAPGSVSPRSGLIRNANSVYLNGRPFREDLERTLERPVRLANDANCLALSEATDGAGAGAGVVFAAILGSGCGAGLVAHGRLLQGFNGVAGEWGHNPLPWPRDDERPPLTCWCGQSGCLELYISGTGLEIDHRARGGEAVDAIAVVDRARGGDAIATAALDRYSDRLARALAVVVNMVDPDVIVLGGGMSNVDELYARVPPLIGGRVFSDVCETPVRKAVHGDSSGVRGAAWLWPLP